MNKFNDLTGYKINKQTSTAFLILITNYQKNKSRKHPIHNHIKSSKYIEINNHEGERTVL